RDDVRNADQDAGVAARSPPQDEALFSRDAVEPAHRNLRHRGAWPGRKVRGRTAGRGQRVLHAGAAAAARARRRPGDPLGDQIPRRARPRARRRGAGSEDAGGRSDDGVSAHGGTGAVAFQRLGAAKRPRDPAAAHGCAVGRCSRARALARAPPGGRACALPRPRFAPAARVGEAPAARGRIGALFRGERRARGSLALLLPSPPGYATALWPPSGIALAALLVLGPRLWPGVWIGSALANLSIDASLPAAIVIATGSTLQALVLSALLRRHVDIAY